MKSFRPMLVVDLVAGFKSGAIEALTGTNMVAENHELTGEEFKEWVSTWKV